ncbi:DUF3515 domain-containing protein [Corynebacterium pseudopelargi]|uniref:DUF3515 domain-containing protein n=1 Tax=Corynebacterium pseudopelargi TaxID=2080757 RepID=A0A3G6IUT7_9CORY|nr:DUF3515 domain-containing protein [Corynebacterium pseudopelargi]AZA09403.1 hypothetical protein CPPEL_06445 [Corynebacterium pseudopelargi]
MSRPEASFRKTPIVLALVLSLLLVLGVLIGAKVVYERVAQQPVAMPALDSPEAESQECQQLIDALPEKLAGHKRAELADPAPAGAAAWASSSTERMTLRCGVSTPLQYTEITPLHEVDGIEWMRVDDATPGSSLHTWFAVNRTPLVALTGDDVALDEQPAPLDALTPALNQLKDKALKPHALPLADVATQASKSCDALLGNLPETLGEDLKATNTSLAQTKAWTAYGKEPVVLRCGVPFPKEYKAGVQLQQVDGVPWFENTILGNGTTASTWYPMGRDVVVAVSMPADGNQVLVQLTKAIKQQTKALDQSER